MASAWGSAWGRAWGNSWGKIQAVIAGGVGSGGGGSSRRLTKSKARSLLESRLKSIEASREEEFTAVAVDEIAQQAEIIRQQEREALIDLAIADAMQLQSRLDMEIKLEFAAIQIAAQLHLFEEEMIFMFMMAMEA